MISDMDWNTLKKFKNQFHLARKAAMLISKDKFSLKIKFDKNESLSTNLDIPPEESISRFVTCVRPFADPSNHLYFKKIWRQIVESDAPGFKIDKETIDNAFRKIEKGPIAIKLDTRNFNALDLFLIYSKGEFFSDRSEEAKIIAEFKKNPILGQLLLYQFYDYSYEVFNACSYLYGLIRQLEKLLPDEVSPIRDTQNDFCCIYCLSKTNSFTSYEHVYPQAFGNTEIILTPGNVCDSCNNEILSQLDDSLVNHDIFSFLRVLFVTYNPKTGKFPKAKYQNISIEKTQPRKLEFIEQSGAKNSFVVDQKENGTVNIKVNTKGRVPFNPIVLSKSLYKIALGLICWQHGADMALDKRFNTARDFIIGKRLDFPNNLLISMTCTPTPLVEGHHNISNPGTVFIMKIFGVILIFNLEEAPLLEMNEHFQALNFKCFALANRQSI